MFKKIIRKIVNLYGYNISKLDKKKKEILPNDIYSSLNNEIKILDQDKLVQINNVIPGMTSNIVGITLFNLCFMQTIKGDVIEIGSFQGRSTSYLAGAVKETMNGKIICIDHFMGNEGKESSYGLDTKTPLDLKNQFLKNIKWAGYDNIVNLINLPSHEAALKIKDKSVRFLFIDGDHSAAGVRKDLQLFEKKLLPGAIIVFDDYYEKYPGLLKSVNEFIKKKKVKKVFKFQYNLVIMI